MSWRKSTATVKTASVHFVLEDGTTACQVYANQWPALLRVVGPWVEPLPHAHLCGLCRSLWPEACLCPKCAARRRQITRSSFRWR